MNYDEVRERLYRVEGAIPYMYKCTGGEVTIGVGHAIQSPEDAGALKLDKGPAAAAQDWSRINAAEAGHTAKSYEALCLCRMSGEEIASLCEADIAKFEKQLKKALPKWDTYPDHAQQALFDMGFNLGVSGLMKFHNLLAAVDRSDGPGAAKECHRKGISEERNQETYDLFYSAWATT